MKKILSLVLCAFVLFGLIGTVFALAEEGSSDDSGSDDDSDSKTETEVKIEDDGRIKIEERSEIDGVKTKIKAEIRANGEFRQKIEQEREDKIAELRMRLKANNGTINIDKIRIRIEGLDEEQKEIIAGKINAKTGLNLTAEDIDGNVTRGQILRAYLSNGAKADVKVMPDRAADIAIKKLRAKCEDNNCTVELREVGRGNKTRAAYVVETEKESRAFFIFKKKMIVSAEIDSETGEVLRVHKPWWSFIAKEKNEKDGDNNDSDEAKVESGIDADVGSENTEVDVNYNGIKEEFVLNTTNEEEIIAEIALRFDFNFEEVKKVITFDVQDDSDEDEENDDDSNEDESEDKLTANLGS